MKKYIVLLLLTITLLPILVQAEDKSIVLKSISLNEKSDNVVEVSPATIKDNKLLVDFKMYEVGDYIEYKIKVQNNSRETLEVDESRLLPSVNYIKYSVDSNSKSIKAGEEKDILLKITYQNKVENGDYFSAKYINQDKIPLVFKSPTIINPETIRNILPILLIIGIMIGYSIYNKKKINLSKAMILLLLLGLIPNIVSALEEEIIIESNIMIRKVKPTACTFDGEMVQGAEYTNGQYTYRYMQERNAGANWSNIETEGWGVTLTEKDSTEAVTSTVCSTINDKPLVSTSYTYQNSKTNKIDTSSLDTKEVTNMAGMFSWIETADYDITNLDTSNVTNMNFMVGHNSALTEMDLSQFDTSKVTNIQSMFQQCDHMQKLNLDNWDLSSLTNAGSAGSGFFVSASSLRELSCKNWIIPENFENIFFRYWVGGNTIMETIDVTGWDLSNTRSIQGIFGSGTPLREIIGMDTWDTSNIENMAYAFQDCTNLTSLDLSGFDTSSLMTAQAIVNGDTSLQKLNMDNWDLSNSTNGSSILGGLLGGTTSLKEMSCKNWKIPTDFSYVFFAIFGGTSSSLEKIDVTGWDLSKTTTIRYLFGPSVGIYSTPVKTIIGLNTWDTSNITDMSYMFYYCNNLTDVDLSSFDTSKVTNMDCMFYCCTSLTNLDLSNFNTSNATSMVSMFINCSSLESLKLDNWDLSNSTNGSSILSGAFFGTTSLKEISCKNWKLPTTFTHVFYRTLAGSSSPIEKIDVTGWDLSKTTSIMGLFGDGDTLKQIIGLNTWDTSNITDMNGMFYGCNIITTLDLSSFDTSNVTNMDLMFKNCNNITTAYGRTQADCNKFNSSSDKPSNVNFIVKPS